VSGRRSRDPSEPAAHVYPPREDSELLRPFAEGTLGRLVLDIGTGNGLLAETAARAGARVVATDLNPWALQGLEDRARADGLAISTVRTDLARGLRRFDVILSNPPYLPTPPAARDPDPWVNLALDGGLDGCGPLARIVDRLAEHLRPGGRAYLLLSSRQDAHRREEIVARWEREGGRSRAVRRRTLGDETLEVREWTPPAGA